MTRTCRVERGREPIGSFVDVAGAASAEVVIQQSRGVRSRAKGGGTAMPTRRSTLTWKSLWLGALVLVLAAIPSVTSASGTLRMAIVADAESLDPILPSDNPSIWTMLLVFDQLVRSGVDGKSIEPGLAQKWEISKDGKTYTFHLRKAQFSKLSSWTASPSLTRTRNRARQPKSRSSRVGYARRTPSCL